MLASHIHSGIDFLIKSRPYSNLKIWPDVVFFSREISNESSIELIAMLPPRTCSVLFCIKRSTRSFPGDAFDRLIHRTI